LAYPIPHVAIQVPEDSLSEYLGKFPETPYKGEQGYLPHPAPRAGYAAMITRMDYQIGLILNLLKKLNLDKNTLIIFSSDNGPTFNGGSDSEFFLSAGPLRGLKCEVYEGGIRVPMLARWPSMIEAGSIIDHVSAFWDIMPTLADIARIKIPKNTDGISFRPTLLGEKNQEKHSHLYWEYHSYNGRQAVRMGDWKGIRLNVSKNPEAPLELYNLKSDLGENHDVAAENPEVIKKIKAIMDSRAPSEVSQWNF
jgi:arylsulfatase